MAEDPIERLQEAAERWRDYSAVSTAARDQVGAGLTRLRELSEQLSATNDRVAELEPAPDTPLEEAKRESAAARRQTEASMRDLMRVVMESVQAIEKRQDDADALHLAIMEVILFIAKRQG
jgi:translation initiation factor 2B subunit (eIF-2B alpha/beta/delta family)